MDFNSTFCPITPINSNNNNNNIKNLPNWDWELSLKPQHSNITTLGGNNITGNGVGCGGTTTTAHSSLPISSSSSSTMSTFSTSTVGLSSCSMQGIMEELQQSRLMVLHDRQSLEQGRRDIISKQSEVKILNEKLKALKDKLETSDKKYATDATDLHHTEIKEKVISESLKTISHEINKTWENLEYIRTQSMRLSNSFLREANDFGLMYNCTDLGKRNRRNAAVKELDALRLQKHQFEYELQPLLQMMKSVEQADKENSTLEQEFRSQNCLSRQREDEVYTKLEEMEEKLSNLKTRDIALDKELEEELNRLKTRLQTIRESISYWERKVSESQRILNYQRNSAVSNDNSNALGLGNNNKPGAGVPPVNSNSTMTNVVMNKGNINMQQIMGNKQIKVSQPVRPTPHFLKPQPAPKTLVENKPPPRFTVPFKTAIPSSSTANSGALKSSSNYFSVQSPFNTNTSNFISKPNYNNSNYHRPPPIQPTISSCSNNYNNQKFNNSSISNSTSHSPLLSQATVSISLENCFQNQNQGKFMFKKKTDSFESSSVNHNTYNNLSKSNQGPLPPFPIFQNNRASLSNQQRFQNRHQ